MKWFREVNFITYMFLLMCVGCTPLIGSHSPKAYENATTLKAEVLTLMSKAEEPYDDHKDEIDSVFLDTEKAYEFVKGIPSNQISEKQWYILKDKNGALMGAFFNRWQRDSKLSKSFIQEFKGQITDAFDEIICLEANKEKPTNCDNKD